MHLPVVTGVCVSFWREIWCQEPLGINQWPLMLESDVMSLCDGLLYFYLAGIGVLLFLRMYRIISRDISLNG